MLKRRIFKTRMYLRYHRQRTIRRILWRLFKDKAVYKPYKDLRGAGAGLQGRYEWRGRVICYVSKHGDLWN